MTEPAAIQTAGLNQTLLQLFKRLTAGSAPNTVFSPFSLAVILAVLAAGARNFAVVRAVCQSPDPYSAICKLLEIHA